jgi:hypothetical protein
MSKRSKSLPTKPKPAGGGVPEEMVLVPSGFTWTNPEQSEFRLTATQGPYTSASGTDMPVATSGSGVALPVFTLVPRRSHEAKVPADDLPPGDERRTRSYGGHDLIISGSMSDVVHGPPSFKLNAATTKSKGRSNSPGKRKLKGK